MIKTRQLSLSAVLIASGVLIPIFFHFIFAGSGKMFLPMHIPVFIGAFFLSPLYSFAVGALTPVISSFLTGMPPLFPMTPIMVAELSCAAFFISVLVKKRLGNVYFQLFAGLLAARVVSGVMVYFLMLVADIDIHPVVFLKTSIITGIPGILLQMIMIPLIVRQIKSK